MPPVSSKYTQKKEVRFDRTQNLLQTRRIQHPYGSPRHRFFRRGYGRQSRGGSGPGGRTYFQPPWSTEPQPYNQQEPPGDNSNIKKLLLKMIVKDLQPLNTVTRLHSLARSLQPSIQVNDSRIQDELQSLYREKRKEVQNAVNAESNLCLSAELWSSSKEMFYLTVSCHLINKEWNQKSYMLETAYLLDDYSPDHVLHQLLRISTEWNITEKIEIVITNVDGIKRAHNSRCKWTFLPCFAHTLDIVFRETIGDSEWKHLLRKCQHIVVYFHQNNKASESLRKHCYYLNLQQNELTQITDLKWLPTLHMLKNILKNWPAIFNVFVENREDDLCLNENERKILKDIVGVLNILKEDMEEIVSQGYSPISNIIPLVQKLQKKLRNQEMIGNQIAQRLSQRCDHHISGIKQNTWFRVSTALDPRYKTRVLWDSGIKDVKTEIRAQIRADAHTVHNSYGTREVSIMEKYWKIYIGKPNLSKNPLEFWRTQIQFKQLATLARKYLTVVSTAIPMERVHQLEKSQAINRRNCLEPENLNMILFLNTN